MLLLLCMCFERSTDLKYNTKLKRQYHQVFTWTSLTIYWKKNQDMERVHNNNMRKTQKNPKTFHATRTQKPHHQDLTQTSLTIRKKNKNKKRKENSRHEETPTTITTCNHHTQTTQITSRHLSSFLPNMYLPTQRSLRLS